MLTICSNENQPDGSKKNSRLYSGREIFFDPIFLSHRVPADPKPGVRPLQDLSGDQSQILPSKAGGPEVHVEVGHRQDHENGCYAPVIVNKDMVIEDGHNRFRICEKHDLPFKMLVFSFADLLEAKQWALDTQKGCRNLDKWGLGKIALKLKPEIEAKAQANMSAGGGNQISAAAKSDLATLPNPISPISALARDATAKRRGQQPPAMRVGLRLRGCSHKEKYDKLKAWN